MSHSFWKLVTIPLLLCLAGSGVLVTPAIAESVGLAGDDSLQGSLPEINQDALEGAVATHADPPPPAGDSGDDGGGGSSSGLVIAGVVVVGGLLLWWWLARDKTEKTVIDMEASNHLLEHRFNKATSLTFDAGPTPRTFMGHRGDRDELKMEDLACGEVGLRVVF